MEWFMPVSGTTMHTIRIIEHLTTRISQCMQNSLQEHYIDICMWAFFQLVNTLYLRPFSRDYSMHSHQLLIELWHISSCRVNTAVNVLQLCAHCTRKKWRPTETALSKSISQFVFCSECLAWYIVMWILGPPTLGIPYQKKWAGEWTWADINMPTLVNKKQVVSER